MKRSDLLAPVANTVTQAMRENSTMSSTRINGSNQEFQVWTDEASDGGAGGGISDQRARHPGREMMRHLLTFTAIVAIGLLMIGLVVVGVTGVNAWSHQAELTRSFEQCMEKAPFKTSLDISGPASFLSAKELRKHFDEFDQIVIETGLPPIWNGEALVPWKIFHKVSIELARQCHAQLGINHPQQQLKGTYARPVWDPNSDIWAP